MNVQKLRAAVGEAYRFIRAADAALATIETSEKQGKWFPVCKETGAVKRVSMDLTRSLAEMRKPS